MDAIIHLLENPFAGLFLNPGLGKTAITLQAFKTLWLKNAATRMLVLAPLRVIYNVWPNEIEKWQNFNGLSYSILHGPRKDDALYKDVDIYLCNPEGMPWLAKTNLWDRVDMLVIDESSMWRNYRTQRFGLIRPKLKAFRRRVILTGTPVPNGLMQLWSQMFLLDQGLRLEQFITRFRRRYFYQIHRPTHTEYELMEGAAGQIYERISDIVMHRSNDVLDLPELTFNNVEVSLPPKVKSTYDTLKTELRVLIDKEGVTALNKGVLSGKLKQLASGGVYNDRGEGEWVHDAKVEALKGLVDELQGQPVLIFYQFRHELERLRGIFDETEVLGGGTGVRDTRRIVRDWNRNEVSVLLLHPAAGGHGLNLQRSSCRTAVWFSIPWDLEHYEQSVARIWRQGQDHHIVVHHIIAKGTIDRTVVRALRDKQNVQEALMEGLRDE